MTQVVLHVGMPKCASTSIQSFFHRNDALHRNHGLCYPMTCREQSGYFSHRLLHTQPSQEIPARVAQIAREAEEAQCYTILLSSEDFINLLWDHEITTQVLAALNATFGIENVTILCLFRNHFTFAESVYAQFLKGGMMFHIPDDAFMKTGNTRIDGFAAQFRTRYGFEFFSYASFIEALRRHAPQNRIELYSIEKDDLGGENIVKVMAKRFGVSPQASQLAVNERYSDTSLLLLHHARRKHGFKRARSRRSLIARLFPEDISQTHFRILHVQGRLFHQIRETSEQDRDCFARLGMNDCPHLFYIPPSFLNRKNMPNGLVPTDWRLRLVDRIMRADEVTLTEARRWMRQMNPVTEKKSADEESASPNAKNLVQRSSMLTNDEVTEHRVFQSESMTIMEKQRYMRQPNLLIIGAQKCGTTWLHYVLNKSNYLHGSKVKELNYWNKKSRGGFEEYCQSFEGGAGTEKYIYESTPHYFRLPINGLNIAKAISEGLGDIPLLLMIRNPVDRYLSSLTHHMMKGRIEWAEEITEIDTRFSMLSLGYYYQIHKLYSQYFSTIHTFLYDDMISNRVTFVENIMASLGLENDINHRYLNVVLNSKTKKLRKMQSSGNTRPLPRLMPAVVQELRELYREDVIGMQNILNRDLQHWLEP